MGGNYMPSTGVIQVDIGRKIGFEVQKVSKEKPEYL